ncbi:RidA family protein [Carnobacteriaceae bacterium zg-ZUI78]|nr:RidA family protein [Carnobacteriaceae bacterium zg-ZUI78]
MKKIESAKAPAAIGPYSQAIQVGNTVYVSGQLPICVETGEFAGSTIEEQTKQSLENIQFILSEAGLTMKNVVKTTVLLKDIADFTKMNDVYASYFSAPFPARAAYQVAALPKDALIEIEVIAVVE